ncbi:MAG: sulfite exporter TauE/SafE family protein [Pseudomonadota bacterium]
MELTLPEFGYALAVVLAAYFVLGVTGFGSAIIAVPLLAHLLPLTKVVPLVVLLDVTATLYMGVRARRQVAGRELAWLMPFAVVGMVIGVTLLVKVPSNQLLLALGVVVIGNGLYSVWGGRPGGVCGRIWALPTGLIAGTVTALFGTGGPLYAIYMARRLADPLQLRATMAMVVMINVLIRLVSYALAGLLLDTRLLLTALALWPAMWLGLRLGNRTHLGMTPAQMRRSFGAVLVLSGVSLLAKALL